MSFSSDIKEELSKKNTLADKTQVKYELIGYLITNRISIINGKILRYATESDYNINRFSKLLNNMGINHQIMIEGNIFVIKLKVKEVPFFINNLEEIKKDIISGNGLKEKKAIIRGSFLGSGTMANPEKGNHLEISFSSKENRDYFLKILKDDFEICAKELDGANKYSLYIKDGEEISKLLALIGANKGILKFEDIRVKKEMKSKVNRLVNCETANLNKTINAAVEQINAIKKLQEDGKFQKLDESLKEIAMLRLEYPNISLLELGKKLKNPIGKSGVNYRLKKIIEIAK